MNLEIWFKIALITVGLAALVLTILIGKKGKAGPNYDALYKIGIILVIAGIAGEILGFLYASGVTLDAFFVLGIVYVSIGLLKKEKNANFDRHQSNHDN
jgi:hypothetical protein